MTRRIMCFAFALVLFVAVFAVLAACQPATQPAVSGKNFTFKANKEARCYLCSLDVKASELPTEGNFWLGALIESKSQPNFEPLYPLFTMSLNGKAEKKGAAFTLEPGQYSITPAVFLLEPGKEIKILAKSETSILPDLPKF